MITRGLAVSDLRFEIGDFRSQPIDSSGHRNLPIAGAGQCVTRGIGRRGWMLAECHGAAAFFP